MLKKIISGGQTGVDQIALDVARSLGIETGGTAAKHWMTENGPNPKLAEYGLVECEYDGYPIRTGYNVRDSHGTVFFGEQSPGFYTTYRATVKFTQPFIYDPTVKALIEFIQDNHIKILNVAGNRGSKLTPQLAKEIEEILLQTFSILFIKRETVV